MKTNKTLADVKPGGRVRLGGELPPLPDFGINTANHASVRIRGFTAEQMRNYARAALSAQPSPGGQDAPVTDEMVDAACRAYYDAAEDAVAVDHTFMEAALKAALAARQPVGEITDTEIDARLNALYREMVDSGQHNGGMSGVAWDRAVYRMASSQAVQAVDLPYSLDADPAGIRARVADAITGTLMVGAQGHTPPPAGHWAEPFWQAARADAGLQVKMREALWAAARSLRTIADSTKETEFLETASEIRAYANSRANCAEQALTDSQAVGNGN